MRILLETKKYSIYCCEFPLQDQSRRLVLSGTLVNNNTEEVEQFYEYWSKDYLTTMENLGKKLYKKAKRIK